jgi:hypothetical protein
MPDEKDDERLFETTANIQRGPHFEENFGKEKDVEILVSGGDGQKLIIRFVASQFLAQNFLF